MVWIYFPESAESRLPLASGSDQSHTARSTDTRKLSSSPECPTGFYQPPLFALTFENSMDERLEDWLTSFTAASPARISALQDLARAWKRSARAYSSRSCGWPKKSDQNSFSLKTSPRSVSEAWRLLGMNWPQQGMTRGGRLYPLLKSERPTRESGGSYLGAPTPGASDGKHRNTVRTATDRLSRGKQITLDGWVQLWPTPTARDHKDGCNVSGVPANGLLRRVIEPSPERGSLTPEFCEWLMGFPKEWTVLNASGTEWFRSRSGRRSRN